MHLARAYELWGGTQEIVLQQKAINPVSRSSFVVHLILAGGQMIENCREAVSVCVATFCVFYGSFLRLCDCLLVWVCERN